MQTTIIIKNIAQKDEAFKKKLAKDCQLHSTAQANGDYYFDEDLNKWVGYWADKGEESEERATIGRTRENKIIERILEMTGTKEIPNFLTYQGDCRGLVIYLNEARMDEEEKKLADKLGLDRDFGGNYSILKR